MKLHYFTRDKASYSFESYVDIMKDEEFNLRVQEQALEDVLNSDDVLDLISDSDLSDIIIPIDSLFDMKTNGVFDWEDKTGEYYGLFDAKIRELCCNLETELGDIVREYRCELSDGYYNFSNDTFSLSLTNFYSGNGEPIGAQLALDIVEHFMKENHWNIGFYDDKNLITDIPNWAKEHILDIKRITPIVLFGNHDVIHDCWSITPETNDLFIKQFWGDYYEGALHFICNADAGCGIYYSVWEYGLEYDSSIFESIKTDCPINLELANEIRTNALYNLIISLYNEYKADTSPLVDKDIYSKDVIGCEIFVASNEYNYSYSKEYHFNLYKIQSLNKDKIEDILWEDEKYRTSFVYLQDLIIDKCDLSSYEHVWKTVNAVIADEQNRLNSSLLCQIRKDGKVLAQVPFSVMLNHKLYTSEIENVVFIKSLIQFLKRGHWHIGYKEASSLPKIYNAMAQEIPQEGKYPIVWFNDSEEIVGKLGIWAAQSQYMLSLTWKSVSDFCSHVFNNIAVHNKYHGTSLYEELKIEFERIKAECPICIKNDSEPVDFEELNNVVSNLHQS